MVYGRSIAIGVCLLFVVFALSALIFYLSLGPCPSGTFACDNGTLCVPQRQICDKRTNCKDGSDEDPVECGLLYGSKKLMDKIVGKAIEKHKRLQQKPHEQQQQRLGEYNFRNISPVAERTNENLTARNGGKNSCAISTYPKLQCTCRKRTILLCGSRAKLLRIPQISSEVTNLMIQYNNNLTIHENAFSGLKYLDKLSLKYNNISTLPLGTFNALRNLECLDMRYNNLKTLPRGIFRGLIAVQWLFLNSNELSNLELDSLSDLPKLEWLIVSDNLLTLNNEKFPHLETLNEIYLDFNRIEYIGDQTFAHLENLHLLKLFTTKAEIIPIHKMYLIVILMVPDHTTTVPIDEIQNILQLFRMFLILDVNIMVATTGKIEIYTFYPYTYGQCGNARPVLLHSCSEIEHGFREESLFPPKSHNLNLCPFKTVVAHLPPFIILAKPFMGEDSLTGIDGEILKVISRKINFTIDLSIDYAGTVYNNNTATGVYAKLQQRIVDQALGYCECTPNRLRLFASTKSYYQTTLLLLLKDSEEYSSLETVFFPFSTPTWIVFLIVITLRGILSILKQYQYHKALHKSVPNILLIMWCFIAIAFRSTYESLFFTFMLHEPLKPLPRSLEELRQQNYKILTDIISGDKVQSIPELNGMLMIANTTPYELLKDFDNWPAKRHGILTNVDTFAYFVKNEPEKLWKYVHLKERLMDQMFCMFFPYMSHFADVFNKRVTQLESFGLLAEIARRFIKSIKIPSTKDYRTKHNNGEGSGKILSTYHLKGPLIIFVCLQAIACSVFVLEILSLKLKLLRRGFLSFTK